MWIDSQVLLLLIWADHLLSPAFRAHNMISIGQHPSSFNSHITRIKLWHAQLATLLDLGSQVKALHLIPIRTQTVQRGNSRAVHLRFVNKVIGHFCIWIKHHIFVV